MQDLKQIEEQLWRYADNECSDAEQAHINNMLLNDAAWQTAYKQVTMMQAALQVQELEQPSMRFTKNVMELIGQTQVAPKASRYLDSAIIRVIAGCFILAVVAMFGYVLLNTKSGGAPTVIDAYTNKLTNSTGLYVIAFVTILLVMALADKLMRRKTNTPTAS